MKNKMRFFSVKDSIFLFMFFVSAVSAQAQKTAFTREDTLRGTITAARGWWDVTYYDLDVTVSPETKSISGSILITYKVIAPHRVMQIDLQPPLVIEKVIQDDRVLIFHREGRNAYHIELVKEQKSNSRESVTIYYSGHPMVAKNPPWEGGFQYAKDAEGNPFIATSCQGLGSSSWWPCKDHSYDEPDSMLMRVTVPMALMDVSNGRLRKTITHENGTRTFEWFVKNPINNYGVNVNIAGYAHFADTLHGEQGILDMDFYVLPNNLEKAKEQFKQAKLMLNAFEYWFGPYPFYEDGYKLVETPYLGMEHQSSVTYGNGYQNGYRGKDLSGTGWGLKWDFIIIHESGHEWFANNITYKDIADMWIHESFTNYSETLFTEYYYGKEAGTDYVVGTRQHIKNDIPIIGIYNVNSRGSGDMYSKGGNLLHTIRHSINDDKLFREILRGLNQTFYHQTVSSEQIENYISEESGWNYKKVFDQYLREVKIPALEYYSKKNKIYYRWTNCVPGFNLPISLHSQGHSLALKPSDRWKKNKVTVEQSALLDSAQLERLYYINAVPVKNKR
jgi:aminopeptidase N